MSDPQTSLPALCHTPAGAFVVEIGNLTPTGCTAAAPEEWAEEFDFLRLTLPGAAEINGCVSSHDGRIATIRFFGQIHPVVIESWQQQAA